MSSEQPEVESQTLPAVEDITPQATIPAPRPHVKNPKRVAAGKLVAERTRIAREQKKKAEAAVANKNEKSAASPSETEPKAESGLSVNQWIGIGGLVVSAAGLFFKRKEIMGAVKKNLPSPPPPVEPATHPPVEPAPQRKVLRKMTGFPPIGKKFLFYTMSCQHREDVCQQYLEEQKILPDSVGCFFLSEMEYVGLGNGTLETKKNLGNAEDIFAGPAKIF